MGKVIDLTGQRFGRLLIIERAEDYINLSGRRIIKWICKCECGNLSVVSTNELRSGDTQSCGCYQKDRVGEAKLIDLVGKTFGRLIVISRANDYISPSGCKQTKWLCKCVCGKEKIINGRHLRDGKTLSCGCYGKEVSKENGEKNGRKNKDRPIDLTGKRFGRLITKYWFRNINNRIYWYCVCDCGNNITTYGSNLTRGLTKSCGCYSREKLSERKFKNLVGKRFGKLIVQYDTKIRKRKRVLWHCLCDCGKETNVSSTNLQEGHTKSCGCLSESFIANKTKEYFIKYYNAEAEYKILKNPKTNRWLPYDIYIHQGDAPELKGIYIEINGKHHYEKSGLHKIQDKNKSESDDDRFKYQKYKDRIKKRFAKRNGTYIEIDLRKIKTVQNSIKRIERIINPLGIKLEKKENNNE
jgi:hypothetical protein